MAATVSVVVPIYNVAPYLDECLRSLARQQFGNLDVIMIDDGSTDHSAEIAARYAETDSRFRLFAQANAGLGAARNVGLEHAQGEYLMFVDSDDALPTYAIESLVSALEETKSDFVTGNVRLLTSRGLSTSRIHRESHKGTTLRTHVSRQVELVTDRLAWNKVFRRDFWDRHGFRFPEGVRYEDTPVTVPAHALARAVDVISLPIYWWRRREGGEPSITQRANEVQAVKDRFSAVMSAAKALATIGPAHVKDAYDDSVLRGDLMLFMRQLPEADEDFRRTFMDLGAEYLATVDDKIVGRLPAQLRVPWHLVREQKLADLIPVVLASRGKTPAVVRRGRHHYRDLPGLDDNKAWLPRELYRTKAVRPLARATELKWEADALRVRGYAYLPGTSSRWPWSSGRALWLRDLKTRRVVPLFTKPQLANGDIDNDRSISYRWSGFDVTVPFERLKGAGPWRNGEWVLNAVVVGWPLASKAPVMATSSASMAGREIAENVWLQPVSSGKALRLDVRRCDTFVSETRIDAQGEWIELVLDSRKALAGARVQLSRVSGVPWRSFPVEVAPGESGSGLCRIPVRELAAVAQEEDLPIPGEDGHRWTVELVRAGKSSPLLLKQSASGIVHTAGSVLLISERTEHGELWLGARPVSPVVTDVRWQDDGTLHLRGVGASPDAGYEVVVRLRGRREDRSYAMRTDGSAWTAIVDPSSAKSLAGTTDLRSGTWSLVCRMPDGRFTDLLFAAGALGNQALGTRVGIRELELRPEPGWRAALVVGPNLRPDEQGAFNRERLTSTVYPRLRRKPLKRAVLYNSFTGRQYSDSPRALHEELARRGTDVEHLWVVRDGQVSLPPTARPVTLWSREWYEALATSAYIITNTHLPAWFQRREGQVVLQTWHGTPLKRIGFDIETIHFDPNYLETITKEVPNWSLLISPNRFSTPILRKAFRYEGEILEVGYPRNDVLASDRSPSVAARVKELLNIDSDRRVILYAPTWRDDDGAPGRFRAQMKLDLDHAQSALADDFVLLVRRHPNVIDEFPVRNQSFVIDVSTYPDIADLLAATDILVTDYSSIMFDFANTRRPMLFFVYDLEHYRDKLRGFYFDFESDPPGPLLRTSEEVIDAIANIESISKQYADAYDRFVEQFCDFDDGQATTRLIDYLFGSNSK